jgi:hypothetical protein
MCGGSDTVQTSTNTTTTPTATPQEQAMEGIQLSEMQGYAPAQGQMYNTAFATGNNLLNAVNQPNSPQWQTLLGGITPQQTQSQVNTQDQALQGSLQQAGIYNSGTAASGRMAAATQLSNTNAQFNVGTLQNALNLALGGQAQVQSTAASNSSQLGQELAGLRTTNTTGTGTMPSTGFNAGILGTWGTSYYGCWVAAEVFNEAMDGIRTSAARFYIANMAPIWFSKMYLKHGEKFAQFIHNKPILKAIIKPLFEFFVRQTQEHVKARVA